MRELQIFCLLFIIVGYTCWKGINTFQFTPKSNKPFEMSLRRFRFVSIGQLLICENTVMLYFMYIKLTAASNKTAYKGFFICAVMVEFSLLKNNCFIKKQSATDSSCFQICLTSATEFSLK